MHVHACTCINYILYIIYSIITIKDSLGIEIRVTEFNIYSLNAGFVRRLGCRFFEWTRVREFIVLQVLQWNVRSHRMSVSFEQRLNVSIEEIFYQITLLFYSGNRKYFWELKFKSFFKKYLNSWKGID